MSSALRVSGLVQDYPGVRALKGVSLSLEAGQVLGLVGENGAGKSTLIRIVGGVEKPTAGTIEVQGEEQRFQSSADSQAKGIAVVSQEFRLVDELSVAENVFLGHEPNSLGVIDRREMNRRAEELLVGLGLELDPRRAVASLTVGDRQLVEIARALSRDFHTLIMDEPTAALNDGEISTLHGIIRRLGASGKAIVYVSHHIDEIFQVCDSVAVLRDGSLVAEQRVSDLSNAELVEQMLGRKPDIFEQSAEQASHESVRLRVVDLEISGLRGPVSLKVHAKEVLGLAGLVGSGRTSITRALFGAKPTQGGIIEIDGKEVRIPSVRAAVRHGIFMLSEDRKSEGILPHLNVVENALASRARRKLPAAQRMMPLAKDEKEQFEKLRQDMRIRVSDNRQLIGNLSGGNQQKVLLARALLSGCKVLLLNEPTRGVDVGAKIEIYHLIHQMAASGVAVVVSSSDAPELEAIADRCLVFFAGQQVAEFEGGQVTQNNLIHAAVGQLKGNAR